MFQLRNQNHAFNFFELIEFNFVFRYDLLKLCLKGPKQKLDQTVHCQPAVMVASLAALEKLNDERPNAIENCMATAGFGSGEIASLVFAGAIPFDQGKQNSHIDTFVFKWDY